MLATGTGTAAPLQPAAEAARAQAIRALAPAHLRDLADRLVLEGKTVDEARAALLTALTTRSAPVGTPETPPPATAGNRQWPADVTPDVLRRSLKRNF